MTVDLTLACYPYEWTRSLRDGRVEPQGVSLTTVDYPNPERFRRMAQRLEFDVCEMSMGTYLASRRAPEEFPFTAIPVFPYRRFRHAYIYRRRDADIETPADIADSRVGIVNWQTTTGIWQRGILAERHGVDLQSIEWVATGTEIVPTDTTGFDIEYRAPPEASAMPQLESMVESGDVDAVLTPVHLDTDAAERLFSDPVETERRYFRETSIFPIMHTVVVRDEVLDDHPWVAQNLFDAFEEAKQAALDGLDHPRWMPLAWSKPLVDKQRELIGDDPWEYGLTERNVATLETLLSYAHQQRVAAEAYDVESLFATDHIDQQWFGPGEG
ncbi:MULTISPECIES: 4,5-dihydroxyphthalate decarboxylase [Haloferax]|uniref:4,5-dihydroxyphthalate decarboxylase n=1 Tax=Haloferax marinum TaxID=2666143 RepID=A0A6A8G600_9EURY|nr:MULTISPECIES: 4,5-dihydroxyphthalate decarboxylase [Haloferax]KAB1196980.1 4,5-dihydroxyphthalate decarboxylase [Haloferax sp. CBA1150]MRW96002.1 4,5-dihydroxyphthalate decarboxylase [Haloferax marinum]